MYPDRSGRQLLCASAPDSQDGRKGPQTKKRSLTNPASWNCEEDEYDPAALSKRAARSAAEREDSPAHFPSGHVQASSRGGNPQTVSNQPGELQILQGVAIFKDYLQRERGNYRAKAKPMTREWTSALRPFFTSALLDRVKIVELSGERTANPHFYPQARALGFTNLPDISHQACVTFIDVVVFNEKLEERKLFHGLVHAAQVQLLGLDRYADLFVRGFLKRRSYFMVPLKAHAFALDLRFVVERSKPFSVEEEIRHWARVGLY